MSKIAGVFLIVGGIAAAAYVLPTTDSAREPEVARSEAAVASAPVAPGKLAASVPPVVVAPALRLDPSNAPSRALPEVPAAAKSALAPAPARVVAVAESPSRPVEPAPLVAKKPGSVKPSDEDARQQLAQDIQRELKRVGCYEGAVSGDWNADTRKGMRTFIDRINATLPIDEPDHILKTLVQGHPGSACGKICPAGQGMSGDGRCTPTAILAQSTKRPVPTLQRAPRPKQAPGWETTVTAMAPLPVAPAPSRPAEAAQPPRGDAPAGRMALAGPRLDAGPGSGSSDPALRAEMKAAAGDPTAGSAPRMKLSAVVPPEGEADNEPSIVAPKPDRDSVAPPRAAAERRPAPTRPRVAYVPPPYNPPSYSPPRQVQRERSNFASTMFTRMEQNRR